MISAGLVVFMSLINNGKVHICLPRLTICSNLEKQIMNYGGISWIIIYKEFNVSPIDVNQHLTPSNGY